MTDDCRKKLCLSCDNTNNEILNVCMKITQDNGTNQALDFVLKLVVVLNIEFNYPSPILQPYVTCWYLVRIFSHLSEIGTHGCPIFQLSLMCLAANNFAQILKAFYF